MFHKWRKKIKNKTGDPKKNIKDSQQTGSNHFHMIARSQRENGNTKNYHKESIKFESSRGNWFFVCAFAHQQVNDVGHSDAKMLLKCALADSSQTAEHLRKKNHNGKERMNKKNNDGTKQIYSSARLHRNFISNETPPTQLYQMIICYFFCAMKFAVAPQRDEYLHARKKKWMKTTAAWGFTLSTVYQVKCAKTPRLLNV